MFTITESHEPQGTILTPMGKINTLTAKTFDVYLKKHIDGGQGALLLDLAGVDFISSFGLRSLLIAAKTLTPKGRAYIIFGLQPPVHDVLRVSGFLKIIQVVAGKAEALALLAEAGGTSN